MLLDSLSADFVFTGYDLAAVLVSSALTLTLAVIIVVSACGALTKAKGQQGDEEGTVFLRRSKVAPEDHMSVINEERRTIQAVLHRLVSRQK